MARLDLGDVALNWHETGAPEGLPVVFASTLGTDLTIWDALCGLLPPGLRLIRYDLRGHGGSSCPPGPYAMGALVRDAERLIEQLGAADCVFVGAGLGGMVGQGLAIKRPDLLQGLVLSNTAAKLGTPGTWAARLAEIERGGLAALAEAELERWFPRRIRRGRDMAPWRDMLLATRPEGYAACCGAISGTDFYTPTALLALPCLVIAGSEDGMTPADLVRETAELIPEAEFQLLRGAGHLAMVDAAEAYAGLLRDFLAGLSAKPAQNPVPARHAHAAGPQAGTGLSLMGTPVPLAGGHAIDCGCGGCHA